MSKSTIRDRVRKIGKLVRIDNLYPHTLRKTSINLLAEVGGIDLASEFANHNSIDVTKKHYIKKTTATEKYQKHEQRKSNKKIIVYFINGEITRNKKKNWILKKRGE